MLEPSPNHRRARPRFQFSLRLLLVMTAVVAALIATSISLYRRRAASLLPMQFNQAIRNGDLAEVDRLLKIDPKLAHGRQYGSGSSSHTPLQRAIGQPSIFDRILKENPDVNDVSSGGGTALHIAVGWRLHAEAKRLLQLGAEVNAVDDRGIAPLHLAVYNRDGNGEMTKLLLDAGADPNLLSRPDQNNDSLEGKSALHRAAETGNEAAVTHMLNSGAQVDRRDIRGRTGLHLAAAHHSSNVARLLVKHGADMLAKDDQGRIPGELKDGASADAAALIWWDQIALSLEKNQRAKLDEMLDKAPQALSFRTDYTPYTMFDRALMTRRLDVLGYLLDRLDPAARAAQAQRLLFEVCGSHQHIDFARRLIDAGADIHAKNKFGLTPLHAAARGHRHDVLRMLITMGADVDARDDFGATALDCAFERNFHDSTGQQTLELLRQAGHPPTVLYAAATGDLDLLQDLTGGSVELLDRSYTHNGIRPLHAAVLGRQPDAIQWLFAQGVEREPLTPRNWGSTRGGDTPLMVALGHNMTDIAILLINHGADVNRKSTSGYYPIHAVIWWDRDPKLLEALLAHGADPTLKYEDQTAAELARDKARYLELLDAATRKSADGR